MVIIVFFIAHWYLSLFAQTFFLHRYAAHQMFTMSKTAEKVFYVLTFIFQGSSYLSPRAYGIMHRLHHAYADTEHDPHSPQYSDNLFHMMWKTKNNYYKILTEPDSVDEKFTKNVPYWPFMEKIADNWMSRLAWIAFYTAFYLQFATQWWMYLLLPIHYVMGPVHGAIINWFAHKFGYINFEVSDTSKNLLPFDFLMFGEGYHNNHHAHGSRANFGGIRWHELDPAYPIILFFDWIGIIRLRKRKSKLETGNISLENS